MVVSGLIFRAGLLFSWSSRNVPIIHSSSSAAAAAASSDVADLLFITSNENLYSPHNDRNKGLISAISLTEH